MYISNIVFMYVCMCMLAENIFAGPEREFHLHESNPFNIKNTLNTLRT